jgi:DNA polymerase sigma
MSNIVWDDVKSQLIVKHFLTWLALLQVGTYNAYALIKEVIRFLDSPIGACVDQLYEASSLL